MLVYGFSNTVGLSSEKKKEMKKKESHLQGQVGRQKYFSNH